LACGFFVAALVFAPASAFAKKTPKTLSGDAAVKAAYLAYEKKDVAAFARLNVKDHPLAAYVDYWSLLTRIKKAKDLSTLDREVARFKKRWQDTPLVVPLLSEWQKEAADRGNWTLYGKHHPLAQNDLELACYDIQYQFHKKGKSALEAAKRTWDITVSPPKSCQEVFTLMRQNKTLTTADIQARYRLLVEHNKVLPARTLWQTLPDRPELKRYLIAERKPFTFLAMRPRPSEKGARELTFLALERAAINDVDRTQAVWARVRNDWSPADRLYGDIRLAYRAARQGHADAFALFRKLPDDAPLTSAQRVAFIRIALKDGQFAAALNAIELLPEIEQLSDVWRYWKARCLEKQNTAAATADAKKLYAELAKELSYYGLLSQERLGITGMPLPQKTLTVDAAAVKKFREHDAVLRMKKLDELGRRPELLREWRQLASNLDRDDLFVAAHALKEAGLPDRSIAAVERVPFTPSQSLMAMLPQTTPAVENAVVAAPVAAAIDPIRNGLNPMFDTEDDIPADLNPMFDDEEALADAADAAPDLTDEPPNDMALRFPKPFNAAFREAAFTYGVDENLLSAVARQESRFVPHIYSSAGATGLMQLMPATARWVAKQISLRGFHTTQLKDPVVNTKLGAFYLRYCLNEFGDSIALAAAAYNAGPHRARRWQKMLPLDGDIWVEQIPFNETRDYVKKILLNHKIYAQQNNTEFSLLDELRLPEAGATVVAAKEEN
jgi:soluble lytic murein transglycosylase-like protein